MAINLAQLVGMMGGGGMGRRFGRGGMGMMRPGGGGMRESAVPMQGDPLGALGALANGASNSPGGMMGGLGANSPSMAKPAEADENDPRDMVNAPLGSNGGPMNAGGFTGGVFDQMNRPGKPDPYAGMLGTGGVESPATTGGMQNYMGGAQGQAGNGAWGPFGGRPTPAMGMKAPGGSEMEQILQMLMRGRR